MTPSAGHEKLQRAWHEHPYITLGTIATFATLLATCWPAFTFATHYYQTADDAKAAHADVERRLAWRDVQELRIEATLSRNRVNECRIKLDNKDQMSRMERDVCAQYEDELRDGQRRYNLALELARSLSGEGKKGETTK